MEPDRPNDSGPKDSNCDGETTSPMKLNVVVCCWAAANFTVISKL